MLFLTDTALDATISTFKGVISLFSDVISISFDLDLDIESHKEQSHVRQRHVSSLKIIAIKISGIFDHVSKLVTNF